MNINDYEQYGDDLIHNPINDKNDEGYKIKDKHEANWALSKIRKLQQEKAENEQFAEEEIDRVNTWLDEENGKLNSNIEWFETALHHYFMKLREQDPKLKTLKLPNGQAQMRKQRPAYKYDNEKLTQFLKEGNYKNLIRVKESPDKTKIKKNAQVIDGKLYLDGVEVDGVAIEERGEKFSVKVVD